MTNTQTLKSWGFFERDGWICSPKLEGEAIFPIDEVDSKDMVYIINVISATAFNSGVRWQREHSKNQLISQMEDMIDTIKNA